jgi:HAD superfamily hydrolase (TIGR01484 family)
MSLTAVATADLSKIKLIATDIDGTLTRNSQFTPQLMTYLLQLQAARIDVLLVTGRSAGWVSGLSNYLPVVGAIGENGGCYVGGDGNCQILPPLTPADIDTHRQQLADSFWHLQGEYPQIQASTDNRFRLTDWTFDLDRLEPHHLWEIATQCQQWGWDFTYSTIQCHLKSTAHSKAAGIEYILDRDFPHLKPHQILTIGDSPNDATMFDPAIFPQSVGVANIQHYRDRMEYLPKSVDRKVNLKWANK